MSLSLLLSATVIGAGTSIATPEPPEPPAKLVDIAPLRLDFQPTSPGALQEEPTGGDATADDFKRTEILATPPRFGTKGTKRWYAQFAYGFDPGDTGTKFQLAGAGFSYFMVDALSINLELNGAYFSQPGDNAWGLNFNLLFRWHFLRERRWSLYADAGAGLLLTTDHVPEDASSLNFTPQAGLGFSIDLGADIRLLLGARWQHISNANLYSNNPGRDSAMGYVALSFPF